MIDHIKPLVQRFFNKRGFEIVRMSTGLRPEEAATIELAKPHTAASLGRNLGMLDAVRYVHENGIPGAIVECGVWRGGSMMIAAKLLKDLGDTSRELYLYDTFEGMSAPTDADVMFDGTKAAAVLNEADKQEGVENYWCYAGVEFVRKNMLLTGYPSERMHFVKGKVEDSIPKTLPGKIALLRLDTDWYESTAHELRHLYPLLVPGGPLIIDDYGHWEGAKRAVDEYFATLKPRPFLSRLDYTGRLAIKPQSP